MVVSLIVIELEGGMAEAIAKQIYSFKRVALQTYPIIFYQLMPGLHKVRLFP